MEFTIIATPKPCQRARGSILFTKKGKPFVNMYDTTPNKKYKKFLHPILHNLMFALPILDGPLAVSLTMYMPHPKTGKRRHFHQMTPDVDNLAKIILDAMNGIVYHDDKQIVCLTVKKRYCRVGDEPRTDVIVEESLDDYGFEE